MCEELKVINLDHFKSIYNFLGRFGMKRRNFLTLSVLAASLAFAGAARAADTIKVGVLDRKSVV